MNLQVIQRPFILPFQDNLVTLPFHGQPQVTAVNGVFGPPDVRHEDEFSGFALYRQDESALAAERDACLGPHAGIFQFHPWAGDVFGHGAAGGVGSPARASGSDKIVFALVFANSRSFHVAVDERRTYFPVCPV